MLSNQNVLEMGPERHLTLVHRITWAAVASSMFTPSVQKSVRLLHSNKVPYFVTDL